MAGIFISYRREDAGGDAGRLYDRLCDRFGRSRVFRDVDTIEPGRRFAHEIEEKLARCDVLIALIGRDWLASTDEQGRRRLDRPDDFVRQEIATALRRGIPVIPALLGRAEMPRAEALPPDLAQLAECQAIEIDDADFHDDVSRLIAALEPRVRGGGVPIVGRRWRRPAVIAAVAVLVIAAAALALVARGAGDARAVVLRNEPGILSADEVSALIVERGHYSARTNPGGAGIAHAYRQEVSAGTPVVLDDASGLMWEQGGSGQIVQGGRAGAAEYVRGLNGRRAAGYTNWRLPTVDEALSLLTPEVHAGFHVDPVFAASAAPFIWTADDAPDRRGWVVYYLDGIAGVEPHGFNAYVRAVRSQ